MDPVFQLRDVLSRYLRSEIDLRALQEGFVPLLPYFAERQDEEPIARMAVAIDNVIVELTTGEATEDDLRAWIEAMPNPTVALAGGPTEPPRGATSSSISEVPVLAFGTVSWRISPVGCARATLESTGLGAVCA
jgi:hypothetical protein